MIQKENQNATRLGLSGDYLLAVFFHGWLGGSDWFQLDVLDQEASIQQGVLRCQENLRIPGSCSGHRGRSRMMALERLSTII